MNSVKKAKLSGVMVITMCMVLIGANIVSVKAANYQDTSWSFSISQPSTHYTSFRNKEDSSKVYVKNYASSPAKVAVLIYGKCSDCADSTKRDCTNNTAAVVNNYPFEINPGTYMYCNNTVKKTYGDLAMAQISLTGYSSGTYSGVWSPDNYYGY
ncbi:MAG: hypothetical protein IJ272_06780 [Clostridia bacterium]|nr:hypothetical protein [Clostridia bacterium]